MTWYVTGFVPVPPPPPVDAVLTPPHDNVDNSKRISNASEMNMSRVRLRWRVGRALKNTIRPGANIHNATCQRSFDALAFVEMLITTSTAELPGVTGLDGLKLHCACAGSPAVHASVTAELNDDPTG